MDDALRRVDEAVLDAAQAGDTVARGVLLEQVLPDVRRVVRRIAGPTDPDLDDLTQEALVALIRALPAHRRDASLWGFATTIAANVCLSAMRRRRRTARLLQALSMRPSPAPPESTARRQRMLLLRTALAALPGPQAQAIALRLLLGHSLAEVASMTGVPVNTVRSRVRLGRATLMRTLAKHPTWAEVCRSEERER